MPSDADDVPSPVQHALHSVAWRNLHSPVLPHRDERRAAEARRHQSKEEGAQILPPVTCQSCEADPNRSVHDIFGGLLPSADVAPIAEEALCSRTVGALSIRFLAQVRDEDVEKAAKVLAFIQLPADSW